MSKLIPVTLKPQNPDAPELKETQSSVSLGEGYCEMPFIYKGKEYTDSCYITPKGEQWCATEVDPKTRKLKKFAYCDIKGKSIKKTQKKDKVKAIIKSPTKKSDKSDKSDKREKSKKDEEPKKEVEPKKEEKVEKEKKEVEPKKVIVKENRKRQDGKYPEDKMEKFKKNKELSNFLLTASDGIRPENYVFPNRKEFVKWFYDTFGERYGAGSKKLEKLQKFQFFNHQKLIRDYMGRDTPYRGILLYHGLGVGKTCGSIAISESFRTNRKICILLNKSLKQNYRENIMKCGAQMLRLNQHWIWFPINKNDKELFDFARAFGMKPSFIEKQGGAWFIDFTKKIPNYKSLKEEEQEKLNLQINTMIDDRYYFYHMDGLTKRKLELMIKNREFDNSVLVIDEVHNLTNAISKKNMGIRARGMLQLILEAENLKLVFLSGTPMINKPYELGVLFTLLRGLMFEYEVVCEGSKDTKLNIDSLAEELRQLPYVGTVEVLPKDKKLLITKNPYGFINTEDDLSKLVRNPKLNIGTEEETLEMIETTIKSKNIKVSSKSIKRHTLFPLNEDEFNEFFLSNTDGQLDVNNIELFKSRIYGLVSHYKTANKDLVPEKRKDEMVSVEMSDYQFFKYSDVRSAEIEMDKNMKKKKKNPEETDEIKSSYRAYSRIHCSFVFPESIKRPFPSDYGIEEDEEFDTNFDDITSDEDIAKEDKKRRIQKYKRYEKEKTKALKELDANKETLLKMDEENGLLKLSPKYNEVLRNLDDVQGTKFIYTEYRTLEGIAVFSIVLKANGYGELVIEKDDKNNLRIKRDPENAPAGYFSTWIGSDENSEILRRVYNNDVSDLPDSIKKDFENMGGTNLRGEVCTILLTTRTGAEGIDLKNVRQVHIIEPYWNPVRLSQVEGRAIRVGSHLELPKEERIVDIYKYSSTITKEQKKENKEIANDFDGLCSDEVLYSISTRKLFLMNKMLRAIKEASIDCSIHIEDTQDMQDPFQCVYNQPNARNKLSYVPSIKRDLTDDQRKRRVVTTSWKPQFIKIKGKEYALKKSDNGGVPDYLYDAKRVRQQQVSNPIGEVRITEDNKKKVIMYKS
jgi:hypothetical protein